MGKETLSLREVSKYYTSGSSVVMALNAVSLTFHTGEFVAITGESGSGKSTLAKIMAGILPYESGEMLLLDRPTSHYGGADWEHYRSDSISFISQSYDILPGCSVLLNVVSALRLTGMEKKAAAKRAEEILQEVELWDMKNRRAAKLSSGQKQRLSIARALAKPAPILIADEPTGNLDKENSDKVVRLLHAAAKDRLVVIITHEFSEVADYATRHIKLQDGIVSFDTVLRPYEDAADAAPVRKRTVPKGLSLYTALLQMGSRPVWSSVMLLFFTLTAFAVFTFLGTFLMNLDDSSTRVYDNSAFRNGNKQRIVVVRADGEPFTEEDVSALLTVEHVNSIERFGFVCDVNYYYREDIDYFLHYRPIGNSADTDATHVEIEVTYSKSNLFVRTVPTLADDSAFLTGGRLPENMFEVVAGDESLLGESFTVYLCDKKNWGVGSQVGIPVTVVGTTDYGSHLYFHDQVGRSITGYILQSHCFVLPNYTEDLGGGFRCSDTLFSQLNFYKDSIGVRFDGNSSMKGWLQSVSEDGLVLDAYGNAGDTLTLPLTGIHPYRLIYTIEVSPEHYEVLVAENAGTQLCIFMEDYAYTDVVLEQVQALGYGALSPYKLSSNRQDEAKAAERMQTLKVCLMVLIAVLALQVVVLRAMFSVEMEEYRLLADLGLRRKNAARSVLWQNALFALGGEAIAVAAIAVCSGRGVERIVSILHYLPAAEALLTWAIHFGAVALSSLWIIHAVNRSVYPATSVKPDLSLDEEVEA